MPIGGMLVRQPVSVGGSGSTYIYGFMDSNYKPGLSKDQCLELTAAGTHCCCCKACWELRSTAGLLALTDSLSLSCLVSQLCLWRWRETAPAAAWSDWRASQRREWRDESYWETSCPNTPHTKHVNVHFVVIIKVSVCPCPPVLL